MQNPLTLVLQDNVDTSIALKYIFLVVLTLNIDLSYFSVLRRHTSSIALKYIFLVVLTLNIDLNTFQC